MKVLEWIFKKLESLLYDETYEQIEDKYWKERLKVERLEEENEDLKYKLERCRF